MLIIAASPDVNIKKFIELLQESSGNFTAISFAEWQNTNIIPKGFVYIKVLPEVSFNRLQKTDRHCTLAQLQTLFEAAHNYFTEKTIMPTELHSIPVLTLNGFIDFETDLSQFYNHLFYIKKLFGSYVPPKTKCCGH